ncbi:GNAT family N-acetyltransferase [Nocardia sp. NPDC057227]|uniref:GNAT family N-acetyltransferase n=1 Tax=Nocardia sp. NPDC057227 TaxID=3346056 RepID=UPI0036437CD4
MPLLDSSPVDVTLFDGPQPVLRDGGLVLRPWAAADAEAVYAAFTDPAVMRWHRRRADSMAEVEGWIRDWQATWPARTAANWAAVADGAVTGRISLTGFDLRSGNAQVAYWTLPAARGRGLAPRGVRAAVALAFAVGFHRLELTHSVHNPASCRTAEKSGFPLESTQREAGLHADGWHDMHLHALVTPAGASG